MKNNRWWSETSLPKRKSVIDIHFRASQKRRTELFLCLRIMHTKSDWVEIDISRNKEWKRFATRSVISESRNCVFGPRMSRLGTRSVQNHDWCGFGVRPSKNLSRGSLRWSKITQKAPEIKKFEISFLTFLSFTQVRIFDSVAHESCNLSCYGHGYRKITPGWA